VKEPPQLLISYSGFDPLSRLQDLHSELREFFFVILQVHLIILREFHKNLFWVPSHHRFHGQFSQPVVSIKDQHLRSYSRLPPDAD